MRILITGITGFVGSHLAEYILTKFPDIEIHGIRRLRSQTDNIAHLNDRVTLHDCDLRDAHNVYDLITQVLPEKIFHLAAQSYVPTSWVAPAETLQTNIIGECNILESVRKLRVGGYDPVIQIAGSSEEYGGVHPDELPCREETPLRPLSPYAVSKVGQEYLAFQYFRSYGIRSIRTRAFNHTGPRRGEVFAESNFAKQVVEIERSIRPPVIKVGNLDAIRDYTDVRDIVHAYWLAAEHCNPEQVYNICSERGHRIGDVLQRYLALSTHPGIEVQRDPSRMRPSDVPILVGSCTRFREATGWTPRYDFLTQTLPDLLGYWRERIPERARAAIAA